MARDHARHAYGPAPTLSLIQISGRLARLMGRTFEIYCNLGNGYDSDGPLNPNSMFMRKKVREVSNYSARLKRFAILNGV